MRGQYIRDLLAGFVIGIIFFFGPGFFHTGWLGWDFFSKILPNTVAVYVLGWWIVPFLIYTITPLYKKRDGYTNIGSVILSFVFYSVGICVSIIGFILAARIAISRYNGL